jgi:hypothetical protein
MTIRPPLTLPAYTPTSWELILPGYPVILGGFRSSSFPELLGSLPSESRWKLFFENMNDAEALALLLPWRATACGLWPLTALPPELAGGVDDENFRRRLTGTTWTIESEPRKEPVMKGRFNVTVDLIYELTLESRYGPRNPLVLVDVSPLLLGMTNIVSIAGVPIALDEALPNLLPAGPLLSMTLTDVENLATVAFPVSLDQSIRREAGLVLDMNLTADIMMIAALEVTAIVPVLVSLPADAFASLTLTDGLTVQADSATKA